VVIMEQEVMASTRSLYRENSLELKELSSWQYKTRKFTLGFLLW
jgi:hypothetical protein